MGSSSNVQRKGERSIQEKDQGIFCAKGARGCLIRAVDYMPDKGGSSWAKKFHDRGTEPESRKRDDDS